MDAPNLVVLEQREQVELSGLPGNDRSRRCHRIEQVRRLIARGKYATPDMIAVTARRLAAEMHREKARDWHSAGISSHRAARAVSLRVVGLGSSEHVAA